MKTHDYHSILLFARDRAGSAKKLAANLGATSGKAVQQWIARGVPHKWRPVLVAKYGRAHSAAKKAAE